MSAAAPAAAPPSSSPPPARGTLRRALEISPELVRGVGTTLALAAVTTLGRVVVPVAVQQTVDRGLLAPGGPDPRLVAWLTGSAAAVVVLTALLSSRVNVRLFTASEAGLATLRTRAFDHVHDLAVLTQNRERRGSLVSRVTSDVDTISTFLQTGGLVLVLSLGQLVLATALMLAYSWELALLVWACFLPLLVAGRPMQRRVQRAYARVRERMGDVLAAVSESVVGADTIRAHAAAARTWRAVDAAVEAHRRDAVRAQVAVASTFATGVLVSGLVVALVLVAGTLLGLAGRITLGELLAFLFLVQLFTQPVLVATEVLNELQNALAGWRRVIAVLDTPVDVPDPGEDGEDLPPGPVDVRLRGVGYAYPPAPGAGELPPPVLRDVDLHLPAGSRVAVVGETGSGKTTLARLVTRLVDPAAGQVLLSGVDARRLRAASLHRRVVAVPQEGFLFDTTVGDNVRLGRPGADERDVRAALADLGLQRWLDSLPQGLATPVGQRGERLSAGERQLVALARAHLAGPDLLVLDEATSAVDPVTEVRLQRALERVQAGRTSIAIAHRLSTAEAADLVVVVAAGRVVEVGPAQQLADAGGAYARLHAAWTAQHA
ncbi:ABC transporter ATP-binding protein [Quadrisphaera sp. DSM 44207]|uniref:ABC transporter ATP-binding protein n=1 Tax=Quadrisphaera sp. DSM 44207 TaxID=1881057 RepID=UPI0008823BDA|nr:ABC transporter ATP-binding protein [Quadrisphaera sp. DSM 44207]SDQ45530.1 ABC-type multidrug transport system, ATPase and permease component [Quadrisphaera sp. DSM 44207]